MKNTWIRSLAVALVVGATSLSAQSCAATNTFANASSHAVNASGEALAAGATSVAGSVQAGAAVVAVPVWMAGSGLAASGAASRAIGDGARKAGEATLHGGDALWDFASGDPAARPALDRKHPVAPPMNQPAPLVTDPSPAAARSRM